MNKDVRQYLKILLNLVIAVTFLLVVVFLVPKIIRFFIPFLIGWIIASIANPFVNFLEKRMKIRRKATSVVVIILVLALVGSAMYLLIAGLFEQGVELVSELPKMWTGFEEEMTGIGEKWEGIYKRLPISFQETLSSLTDNLSTYIGDVVKQISPPAMNAMGNFVKSIPNVLVNIIMCFLSSYYFVSEREDVYRFFRTHIPLSVQQKWLVGYRSMKRSVGGYFLAQFRIELWIYVLLVIGLMILGVHYALLFALLIAVLDLLPVFGTGTILLPWALVRLLSTDYRMAIGLVVVWGVCQLVRQLIQPKFIGDTVGVKTLPTLFLLYIGYRAAGVIGMIIAVPVGIIVMNLNEAGAFDETKNSVRLLVKKVNGFRRLSKEDLDCIHQDESGDSMSFDDESVDDIDWINDNRYNDIKRELISRIRQIKKEEDDNRHE